MNTQNNIMIKSAGVNVSLDIEKIAQELTAAFLLDFQRRSGRIKKIVLLNSDQEILGELSRRIGEHLSTRAELHQEFQGMPIVSRNGDYCHEEGDYAFDVDWIRRLYEKGGGLEIDSLPYKKHIL
jgi:hypothetical protein